VTLDIQWLELEGAAVLRPRRFDDARGWFSETWSEESLRNIGIHFQATQDNQSLSRHQGTLRGLHFQTGAFAQAKLLRVLRGAIRDVLVDLRPESAGFGRWLARDMDAADGTQIFIPRGFAHGFVTLAPDTEVFYKVDTPYAPAHAGAIRFDDPELAIDWGICSKAVTLSPADRDAASFASWRQRNA